MPETASSAFTKILPVLLAIVAGGLGIYWFQAGQGKVEPQTPAATVPASGLKAFATGPLAAFVVKPERKPLPDIAFQDGAGAAKKLSDWKGRVVLLNMWATWCAPCRKEMPDLARLQQTLGSSDFEVVAVSVDLKGAAASSAFLNDVGATSLALYVDPSTKILAALQELGLPATILVDRHGREVGRMVGPAAWASPEAAALIKASIAEKD
jgi:thiol-disulfide isomerase/thioredoxin